MVFTLSRLWARLSISALSLRPAIPVVGHFGVQGERAVMNSGHAPAGCSAEEAASILELVKASIDAGIFAALFEHTSVELTKWCYENLPVAVASLGSRTLRTRDFPRFQRHNRLFSLPYSAKA